MPATEYPLTATDWTDCGASDDCTMQVIGDGIVLMTTAAAKPDTTSTAGLRLGFGPGLYRDAPIKVVGRKVWARALKGANTVVVER